MALTSMYFLWDGPSLLQELNADGTVMEERTNYRSPIDGIAQLLETNRPGQAQPKLYIDAEGSSSAHTYDAVNRRTQTTYVLVRSTWRVLAL